MPAADQTMPVLDAFLDGDVNAASLAAWCAEQVTVPLGGLTIEVLASTSAATTYVQRLSTPPSRGLWWNGSLPRTSGEPETRTS